MSRYAEKSGRLVLVWSTIQLFQILFVFSSWAQMRWQHRHKNQLDDDDELLLVDVISAYPVRMFALIWFSLWSIVFTLSGVISLRRYRNKKSLGFFVGMSIAQGTWMTQAAVETGRRLHLKKTTNYHDKGYVEAMALSALVVCILYFVFAGLLLSWQDDLILERRFRNPQTTIGDSDVSHQPQTLFIRNDTSTRDETPSKARSSAGESVIQS